jgi:hypothetical protein
MDSDGYPTEDLLEEIRKWDATDFIGLMTYIKPLWKYAESGYWSVRGNYYHLSTAGWSGNESIVGALQDNHVWWMLYAYSWRVGGHYVFKRRKIKKV